MEILIEIEDVLKQMKDNDIKQIVEWMNAADSLTSKFKLIIPIIPTILKIEQGLSVNKPLKNWRNFGVVW
jgi:hypothetical protein